MFLAKNSVVDIMLLWRWSSDAFLIYIKRAVLERSLGIAAGIIQNNKLTIIPAETSTTIMSHNQLSLSFGSNDASSYIYSPNFHLHH